MSAQAVLDRPTLVLNRRWEPLHLAPVKEAICLVAKGSARVIDPETFEAHDLRTWGDVSRARATFAEAVIRSPRMVLVPPEVIVLTRYEGLAERSVVFSRRNLFKRDRYTCFASGTPIQMENGSWKPIDLLEIGDVVLSASGKSMPVLQRRAKLPDKKCLLVKSYYGLPVTCTEDHRFLTYDGERESWTEAKNLVGKHVLRPVRSCRTSIDRAMARIIGYYTAEGSTTGKDGADFYVRFTIAPGEDDIASDLKTLIRECFGKELSDRIVTDKRTGWHYRVLGVSSVEVSRAIAKYVKGKQPTRHFTFEPALLDAESAKNLLETMMAGDGCAIKMRDSACRIYVTASRTLALQVQGILFSLGHFASVIEGVQKGGFGEGNKFYHVRWFPETNRTLGKMVEIGGTKYIAMPIQYVKPVEYDGPVWDIEVGANEEIDHSFVTPSGVAHNCQYCGSQPGPESLTVDHVVPKSRGGVSSWTNCVMACLECNKRKSNRTPEEARMKLRKVPKKPSWRALAQVPPRQRRQSWDQFISQSYWEIELEP